MANTQEWVCTNATCKCKTVLISQPASGKAAPRCSCGAIMKKVYSSPKLTALLGAHGTFAHEPVCPKR